jgi:predicted aldo/keto reductase-like oxidoreductase
MEYSLLGKTGRRVSRIGFGGATAGLKNYTGDFDPQRDRDKVITCIRKAYNLGINYFDTAAAYGDGASEDIFGEALEPFPKEDIFLASKVTIADYSDARRSMEASLKRLRRDSIDLFQVHGSCYSQRDFDRVMKKGGMLDALEKAKEEGLMKHIGFSIECQNEPLYAFLKSGRFEVMQIEYNILFQHPYDPSWNCGSMVDAEELGLGIVVMRTATSGIFQKWIQAVNPENTFNYNPALVQLVLSNPLVDVALIGMRDEAVLMENVDTCNDLSGRLDLKALHNRYIK